MTTDPKDALPPRLDPTCACICHSQPGIAHIAPCCRAPASDNMMDAILSNPDGGQWAETSSPDPKDAEIARYDLDLMESPHK